jgi:cell division transport system permease protein
MRTLERAWRGGRSEWRMHAVSGLSASLAFTCLVFALILVVNLRGIEERWRGAGRVSAFLAPQATEEQANVVARALRKSPDVVSVRYVSSESARSELIDGSPSTLLEALPHEAFPASLEIQFGEGVDPVRRGTLVQQLRQLPEIESAETYESWTSRLAGFAEAASVVAGLLSLVVFLAVAAVVSSSTKLMLERRRNEVEVLRIVGATSEYVSRPFMLEGAFQGGVGALSAVLASLAVFIFMNQHFDEQLQLLLGIRPRFLPWFLSVGLVSIGAVLGSLAAVFSLRRSFHA